MIVPLTEINPDSEPVRTLLLALDLCGTFAFALSGAMAAVRRRLDVYGVFVLAVVTSTFGGIGRDLLIGSVPPAALIDERYFGVSLLAGLIAFLWSPAIEKFRNPVRLLDAAGLAFFCVAGAQKALAFGLSPVMAALLGMLTGIGGGMIRDVLLAEVPAVLRRTELYAVAALAGSALVVVGDLLFAAPVPIAIAAGMLCFGIRVLAIRRGWRLPIAPGSPPPDKES